jgi:ribosomal protein S18 acetylase RimI-like enzyme
MGAKARYAHLNLVESSRRLFELDSGVEVEDGDGWTFAAGRANHPVISNAAFRRDDRVAADELLERARSFFGSRGRGFAVWARAGEAADRDLIAACESDGLRNVFEMPEMVLIGPVEERPTPDGFELGRVASAEDAADYWRVASSSYASIGFPPEVFAYYDDADGLFADRIAAFLARRDGRPAAIAMTIVSHGVAGIYWVGCTEEARGRGLGWSVTAAAVDAGFEMGAELASLQASPMGESLYRRMGFEAIYDYRLYLCPEPGGGR